MTNDARIPAGVPTGGQFAAQNRPEGDVQLPSPSKAVIVPIVGQLSLDESYFEPLPDYPASLPEAEVAIDWDGGARAYIVVDGQGFTFWGVDHGDTTETYNSISDTGDTTDWDEETEDAFVEWGTAVWERIDASVYDAQMKAVSGEVQAAILDVAVGRPYQRQNAVYTTAEMEHDAPKRAVTRAADGLSRWFTSGDGEDVDDYTVQGAVSDLRHYADTLGIDWSELLEAANRTYTDERVNPAG